MATWTFSKYLSKWWYSQDELTVLDYFFTNTDKNVYCAKDTLPNQVWAFLMGQYSRSHLSLRDRFLKVIDDQRVAFEQGKIEESDFVSLEDLALHIRQWNSSKLAYFYDRAASFLKKWWVEYGHNSLKDSDVVRFAVEWVSEVFTKIIESPYPALWAFQETSTRYMPFSKDSILITPEIEKSVFYKEIKWSLEKLFETYEKGLVIVRDTLISNDIFKREDFMSDTAFESTVKTKAFDICRYLLPTATATKLWCSFQTRTLESHLSWMLSHPLEEARVVAKSIWEEALKVSPGLLSHVWENEYEKWIYADLANVADTITDKVDWVWKIEKWISNERRVSVISCPDLDSEIATSLLFESSRKSGMSYKECKDLINEKPELKEKIIDAALAKRWRFDRMPRALQHCTVMTEFFMDFWAYRDLQRHRATKQIWQWATSIHGYDYPEYIDLPWMEEFKKLYDEVMTEVSELWQKVIMKDSFAAEYVSALWHLVRTTFEMDPGQIAYVVELRTTPQAHHSYRNLMIRFYEEIKEKAPIFSSYIRCWSWDSSRKDEIEKAQKKSLN